MASTPPEGRARTGVSLAMVLLATVLTLGVGAALKAPCASGGWEDGRQYRQLCYTDIVPLFGTEHLQEGRLPYLDPCPAGEGQCDEYPVLTMYLMRLAAFPANGYASFLWLNALLLGLFALATAFLLHRMVEGRALYFALAPTLLVYAFVNWDLFPVALATGATLAYLRGRDTLAGALIGLGAAAKLYPALLLLPFVAGRLQAGRPRGAGRMAACAAAVYAAVNLPFLLAARDEWLTFFRFNAARPVDWDSLWFVACSRLQDSGSCSWSPRLINALSLAAFGALVGVLWLVRRRLHPDFPRWTLAFPVVVAFLLTNKVYSPQFSLWLLPLFALALPNPWLFAAFEAADVAVFVTRFSFFGELAAESGSPAFEGYSGASLEAFQLALAIRAAILVACLVTWAARTREDPAVARLLPVEPPAGRGAHRRRRPGARPAAGAYPGGVASA